MTQAKSAGPYVRPMKNWWRRDPFFMHYMIREATAVFVAVYALILMVGLVRLAQGEAAWNGWLTALKSPVSVAFHLLMLAAFAVHTWSWFRIMPKTMPIIFIGANRVPPNVITGAGVAAAVVACAAVFLAARWMP